MYKLESELSFFSPLPSTYSFTTDHLPISFHEHETWIIHDHSTFVGIYNRRMIRTI